MVVRTVCILALVCCCSAATDSAKSKKAGKALVAWLAQKPTVRKAALAAEWKAKKIRLGKLEMRFDYRVYGKKPKDGWALFISMHGGGNAKPQVNDQQWRNQIRLYKPKNAIYLAPRAPTNTWNLWHEKHIDAFFDRLIEGAVMCMDVDVNRVYIMGYSAGGDGVYQLAQRMADRWAAASVMAGRPQRDEATWCAEHRVYDPHGRARRRIQT